MCSIYWQIIKLNDINARLQGITVNLSKCMLRERKENRNFFAIRGDIRKSYNIIYYELKELIKKNKLMHLYYLIFSIPHVIFLYRGLSSL